ncbi:hypothetical protein [Paracoccus marinaquae]|uniref:MBG domain-containing protein n=1 Tax=Paracoccus marinaquae TaxID=2841926 RepID=A0ABS6ALB7_9RHOB|nr:hypothetical protein [Paracoccus marinaquae]MBU3031363.1 hypothetical protein [Paracoccus marinaquae]
MATNDEGTTDWAGSNEAGPIEAALIAPSNTAEPSISPSSGPVGAVFTITEGTYAGSTPITVSGTLTQAGVDVTGSMTGDSFTSTAEGALVWVETASNVAGSGRGNRQRDDHGGAIAGTDRRNRGCGRHRQQPAGDGHRDPRLAGFWRPDDDDLAG